MKRIILLSLCTLFGFSAGHAQEAKKKGKETANFHVSNMECQNCVKKIEKNIAFEKGVTDMKVDLPTRTVNVTYRTDKTDEKKLSEAFKKIGYEAVAMKDEAESSASGEGK